MVFIVQTRKVNFLTIIFLLTTNVLINGISYALPAESDQQAHDQWLKNRFSGQHQTLIPIVAVADMFFSCNRERKSDPTSYEIKDLITKMDKTLLAEKLINCMAGESLKSEQALNYGLLGCFHEQLSDLPEAEKTQKMQLVQRAINSLSLEERKKSLTQCVTDQAINYLK